MKVGIYTLGCKVNTYESEYITHLLKDNGYEIGNFDDICDVYVINTCTVTNTSDIKSRKIIRQAKRRNPSACIVAMGCYIEANKNLVMEEIDIAIGNKDKSKIVELIERFFDEKSKCLHTFSELGDQFEDMFISDYFSKTRAFVKIQDGCENFCSYCIIPFVRGKCRSKEMNTTLEEITTLVKNGFKEIVLTGIHTGNYGVDLGTNFASLLEKIVAIEGLKRLRISSIEVTELNDQVLNIIKKHRVIVDHLHIPIQAASDKVLKIMNRKYDLNYFMGKIEEIRKIRPDISITTDIIAGHPGEDENTFNDSLEILKKINFSKLHVFPYSVRSNTKSATLEQIPENIKKEHAKKLLNLSIELEKKYMNQFLDTTKEVLVETQHDGYCLGHTDNYLLVKVMGNYPSGTFLSVVITDVSYPYCLGEVV